MDPEHDLFSDSQSWERALDRFGAVTQLSVVLFDARNGAAVVGPVPPTPLYSALGECEFQTRSFSECARRCLGQPSDRPAVVLEPEFGVGVIGTSLVLSGKVVGAALAGYALLDFPSPAGIERLARAAGVPYRRLWDVARRQQPVPERRLIVWVELLQVLGETLLRETERTREQEETSASLAAQMAAKDEFLAVLSHELRTPLSPILNWARILDQRAGDVALCRKAAAAIERSARLQVKLVDDLLDLNRVARGQVLPLELADRDLTLLLRTAVESIAEAASAKALTLEVDDPGEPLTVSCDAGRLQQVFLNVLSNAVKFTPAGGRVEVTAHREGQQAVVRVADSGEGIDAAFLPHVFDIFRQQEIGTRRQHPGLGIGLAVVKRLVELHGGTVEVRSGGTEQGTNVILRLPIVEPAGEPPGRDVAGDDLASSARKPARSLEGVTVLVVEDTVETLESTSLLLEILGAQVLRAGDGVEALEVLERDRPDLILCDLRMPRMDGFEFLRELELRQGASRPPVVAVSGFGSPGDLRHTGEAGFAAHLVKPADGAALVDAVLDAAPHRA